MSRLRASDEAGLSLIEVLVTMSLMMLVITLATGSVIQALQAQRRQVEYTMVLNNAKITMEQMTRDIRGANPVLGENLATLTDPVSPSPDRLRLEIVNRTDDERRTVTYSLEDSPDGCGPGVVDCQRLRVTEIRQEISTGAQTADMNRILLDGIAFDPGESLFYFEDAAGDQLPFDPANGIAISPAAVRVVVASLRLALLESDATVELEQTISVRNQEVSA